MSWPRVLAVALLAGGGLALPPGPARADRPLPPQARYEAGTSLTLGWRALSHGLSDAAIAASQRATELEPDNPTAWLLLARSHTLQEDWPAARRAAVRCVDLAPDVHEALLLLGRIQVELADRPGAVATFERAAAQEGGGPGAHLGRALVAARMDRDWEQVAVELRALIDEEPDARLATLPLRPSWRPVADEPEFIAALESVLRASLRVDGEPGPRTKEPPRR